MKLSTQIASTLGARIVSVAADESMSTESLTWIRAYTTQLVDIVEGLNTFSNTALDELRDIRAENAYLRNQLAEFRTNPVTPTGEPQ